MSSFDPHHPVVQRIALIVGIAAFVVLVLGVSYSSMWDLWQTSDHRHGLMVFPISMFLVWRLRRELSDVALAPDSKGLLLVAPMAVAWLVSRLAGIQAAEHLLALLMIPAAVAALAGPKMAVKLLFPLLFLLLAMPLGDALVPYLMVITADLSAGMLQLSGFPVFRDGQNISLPGGNFVVADVCSGLNYLSTGVMVSLLFGYLTYSSMQKRILIVAATVVIVVMANGIRAYIVMAVASMTRMQYLGGQDHIYFGWLMFGVVIMLIMWVGARFADEEEEAGRDPSDTTSVRATHNALPLIAALGLVMLAVTVNPMQADVGESGAMLAIAAALLVFLFMLARRKDGEDQPQSGRSRAAVFRFGWGRVVVVVATLVILVMMPRFATTIEDRTVDLIEEIELETMVPCTLAGPWQNDWHPNFSNADLERSATFKCNGEAVSIFVAAYASTLQGNELVSSSNYVIPPHWERISQISSFTVRDRAGRDRRISETVATIGAHETVVWHWYEIDDRTAISPLMVKAYQVLALIIGRPAGGRVVVIETPVYPDIQQTRDSLKSVAISIMEAEPR